MLSASGFNANDEWIGCLLLAWLHDKMEMRIVQQTNLDYFESSFEHYIIAKVSNVMTQKHTLTEHDGGNVSDLDRS